MKSYRTAVSSSTCRVRAAPFCAVLFGLAITNVARADEALDAAAADALYDQAQKHMAKGEFDRACRLLDASEKLDSGVGTLLTLGECYDKTGRSASAWTTFQEAAALAKNTNQAPREKLARRKAAAIEPNVSKLVINVPPSSVLEGLEVKRDDQVVDKAQWGAPVPMDPGEHTISSAAPGHIPWSSKVRVVPKGSSTIVEVPSLQSIPPPPREEASLHVVKSPAPRDEAHMSVQRILGFVAGGVGIAGIGTGIGLGVYALSKHDDAQMLFCGATCSGGGGDMVQAQAKRLAIGSTIAFIAGGTFTAGGIVLVLTAPSEKLAASSIHVAPLISQGSTGFTFYGTF